MTQADVTPAPAPPAPIGPPPPPRGPGLYAPFPAPPTEGRRSRVGLGLGIGAAVVLLVCGGGVAAVFGLLTVASRALNEQAEVVVGDYLGDLKAKRYTEAYNRLCEPVKATTTVAEFTSRAGAEEPITSWQVGDVDLTDVTLGVPVDVVYADGDTGQLRASLGQNRETGEFQLCSLEE